MLQKTSKEFRTLFLLQFTKELIKNTKRDELNFLKEKIKKNIKKQTLPKKQIRRIPKNLPLIRIPEQRLPPTVQYMKPYPTTIQIDLGKLNALIRDQTVTVIECNEADKNVRVKRVRGETRMTNIKLTEQEINQVIQKFAQTARIPIQQGIFKAAAGKLIISAIISDNNSKFLITKMLI